jgi:hypothetical protein
MTRTRVTEPKRHFTGGGVFHKGASRVTCDPGFAICPQSFYPRDKAQRATRWADVTCKNCLKWKGYEERDQ